jgi:hypothetical protein
MRKKLLSAEQNTKMFFEAWTQMGGSLFIERKEMGF